VVKTKLKVFLFRILRKFLPVIWKFKSQNLEPSLLKVLQEEMSLLKTGTTWDDFQLKIYSELERLGVSRFRLSPTLISTMDPPLPFLISSIAALNDNDQIYVKKLAKNYIKVGGGKRGTIYFNAPDSRIQKILTLLDLKSDLAKYYKPNSENNSYEFIEFGGGIGQFAELVIREMNPISYTIIDLPLVSVLAKCYLSHQNLNYKINFIDKAEDIVLSKKSIKVFISSWAISEISLEKRRQVEQYMAKMDFLLLEIQDFFDGIDNFEWITNFLIRNPQFSSNQSRSNRAMKSRVYKIHRIR
jgi:hypothetical protein